MSIFCNVTFFEKILYIPGNHEFYKIGNYEPNTFNNLLKIMYDLEKEIPNLVILNCSSYIIGNTKFRIVMILFFRNCNNLH